MSFKSNPTLVPDRDSLPFKKRDQRQSTPPPQQPPPQQQQQQQCDAATFKAPYPYNSHSEFKIKHTGPFQPVPRRVPALYQPWMHTHVPTRSKPHILSAFREHHGWPEWREFNPLHPGWDFSHHYQHHSHLPGHHREISFGPGHPHHTSRFNPVSPVTEGFHRMGGEYSWEQLKTLRDKSLNTERQSNGRNKGPYVRRKEKGVEYFPRVEKVSPPSLSACLPHSLHGDLILQHDLLHKSAKVLKHPVSGPSLHSFKRVSPDNLNNTCTSTTEDASRSPALPSSERTNTSFSSSNRFPWLLPHFVAGSLIELRDGRLRRVEHLQTEDFLLGSLACPDLRLSCCTVQSISPSASPSSISRLLILLHDQQSQELVDVYVEYPFFVRGRGWSSCSPQRTARLCGLQCHQLSVGDVCLALTPVSTTQSSPSATLESETSPRKSEGECGSLKASHPQVPPGPERPVRRRHYSAPELRGPCTNCM
ncbi:hypothetical protein PAMP_017900 [Pampus punctatissimus]